MIRVPSWVSNPLGKYYLYFAHHKGKYIRMAYSNSLVGPYTLYQDGLGVLTLENSEGTDHVASPDVIIDEENKRFILYYHSPSPNHNNDQYTFIALSTDGLEFAALGEGKVALPYVRVFDYNDNWFAWGKDFYRGGVFQRSTGPLDAFEEFDGTCVHLTQGVDAARHAATWVLGKNSLDGKSTSGNDVSSTKTADDDMLYVVYSQIPDKPEHLVMVGVNLSLPFEEWMCHDNQSIDLLFPEFDYEGVNAPIRNSVSGVSYNELHELRDPDVFVDNGRVYLLYSVKGEKGIAIAEITWTFNS
eukprot:m.54823 g.54823  ORF g.54823 m.54823 type:complete len:301 (-) comp11093_c0_seq3:154-1056(-)